MLIKDMMKKKMERKRFLFRDSVTTINTPIGEFEVERMDSTHIKLRPMGSKDWGVPLHFKQVSSAIIDKLREVGLVAGDSFEIKDSVTDKDPSITEGSKVRINYGRFKGKRGIVKEIGVDDDYAIVKVGGTTETMFIGDLKKIGFSDTMNSNGRGLAGACGEERKYDGKGPRHKSFIKDVWTKNISGYNITINGGGEDFPFKVEKNGKIVFEGESKSLSEAFSQVESKIREMSKDSSNEENEIYYPDKNIEEADWTKKSWDLPPYKSKDFMKVVKDLDSFRKLPVYKNAVKKGLIKDDKWVGKKKEVKDGGPGSGINKKYRKE
jgi:hypothetical protein